MPKRKGTNDIAANVRGAFLRACKHLENDGRPLSSIIMEMLENDPKGCLDTVAKFVPKEMLIEATITQQLEEMPDEALEREIGRLVRDTAALPLTQGTGSPAKH